MRLRGELHVRADLGETLGEFPRAPDRAMNTHFCRLVFPPTTMVGLHESVGGLPSHPYLNRTPSALPALGPNEFNASII
jgi:hypothetical protein